MPYEVINEKGDLFYQPKDKNNLNCYLLYKITPDRLMIPTKQGVRGVVGKDLEGWQKMIEQLDAMGYSGLMLKISAPRTEIKIQGGKS